MKHASRAARSLIIGMLALTSTVAASNETVNTGLLAGLNATQVAQAFGNAWAQGSDYVCAVMQNTLTVTDVSGDCNQPVSRYTFTVDGGILAVNHTASLKLVCQSPLVASFDLDGGGFIPLSQGGNSFSSGGDTININFVNFTPSSGKPALPKWGIPVLSVLLAIGGTALVHRRRTAPASD